MRKINGVIKYFSDLIRSLGPHKFLVGGEFSIADIAVGAMLGTMKFVESDFKLISWKEENAELRAYWEWLEERESFRKTRPEMFALSEKVA